MLGAEKALSNMVRLNSYAISIPLSISGTLTQPDDESSECWSRIVSDAQASGRTTLAIEFQATKIADENILVAGVDRNGRLLVGSCEGLSYIASSWEQTASGWSLRWSNL